MTRPSLLSRSTLGQPNYLVIAIVAAFLAAFIPGGARRAVDGLSSRETDWLEPAAPAAADLAWFDRHFGGQRTVVVSWDGCTLEDSEKLSLLARSLAPAGREGGREVEASAWFERIVTGPQAVAALTTAPNNLSFHEATSRLEGSFVGPRRRGAADNTAADRARTTCLVAVLTPTAAADPATARAALNRIADLAVEKCGVSSGVLHLGGPLVESEAVATAATRALSGWALVVGIIALGIAYVRSRNEAVSAAVALAGAVAGGVALAAVFYTGVIEVLAFGRTAPQWGVLTPLAATLPAIAFVLATVGALSLVDRWRVARCADAEGAAEDAAGNYWRPALAAAAFVAIGLAVLEVSGIQPLQQFGYLGAVAILATVGVVVALTSVILHRFAKERDVAAGEPVDRGRIAEFVESISAAMIHNPMPTLTVAALAIAGCVAGVLQLDFDVSQNALIADRSRAAQDRAWFAENLTSLAPHEVVLAFPVERLRPASESAEADGRQYRMTPAERAELARQIAARLNSLAEVTSVLSPAAFDSSNDLEPGRVEGLHEALVAAERDPRTGDPTGRQLWRLSARVQPEALQRPGDYPPFHREVQAAVDPLLIAVQQRDYVVRALHERGSELAGAKACILFRTPNSAEAPPEDSQELALGRLLVASGASRAHLTYLNLVDYDKPGKSNLRGDRAHRAAIEQRLSGFDVVVLASAPSDPSARTLFAGGVPLVEVADLPPIEETAATPGVDDGSPRPVTATFASLAAVESRAAARVAATMPGLLLAIGAVVLAAMILVTRDFIGGAAASVAAGLPAAIVLGVAGWAGLSAGVGVIALGTAALALGMYAAVEYLTWLRRSRLAGLDLVAANHEACRRLAKPWSDAAIVGGVALAPLALCAFTPLVQFGAMAIVLFASAAACGLALLPALVASPLGPFFDISPEDDPVAVEMTAAEGIVAIPRPHFDAPAGASVGVHERTDSGSPAVPRIHGRRHAELGADEDEDALSAAAATRESLKAKLEQLRKRARRQA